MASGGTYPTTTGRGEEKAPPRWSHATYQYITSAETWQRGLGSIQPSQANSRTLGHSGPSGFPSVKRSFCSTDPVEHLLRLAAIDYNLNSIEGLSKVN